MHWFQHPSRSFTWFALSTVTLSVHCARLAPDAAVTSTGGSVSSGGGQALGGRACGFPGAGQLASCSGGQASGLAGGGSGGSGETLVSGGGAGKADAGSSAGLGESGSGGASASAGESGVGGVPSPESALLPERSVIETNPEALTKLSFARVFERLHPVVGEDTTIYDAYAALLDSFEPLRDGEVQTTPRCDDETRGTDWNDPNFSTLNGFPAPCLPEVPELESLEFPYWEPLAAINRFDLAPLNGANCGEQHLNFYYNTIDVPSPLKFNLRAYLRFAAVIENPNPELGLEGCRPLVNYWASLSRAEYADPKLRAQALEYAFFGSSVDPLSPALGPEVMGLNQTDILPFISPRHFGRKGRLQWLFRGTRSVWFFFEHALVSRAEGLVLRRPVTQSLATNEFFLDHPKTALCTASLLERPVLAGLLENDLSRMTLNISPECFAAASTSLGAGFSDTLYETLPATDLGKKIDVALAKYFPDSDIRARELGVRMDFAGTCFGCHDRPNWLRPDSISHVKEDRAEPCGSSGGECYARSPLLTDDLLPRWTAVLNEFWLNPSSSPPPTAAAGETIGGAAVVRGNP